MTRYAAKTSVSAERSRGEIEVTLRRYGADGFAYAAQDGKAMIGFRINKRQVRFMLPLPDEMLFAYDGRKHERTESERREHWNQGCRSAWRALNLSVKAKLEAVASGIVTFEEEFMAQLVLPGGKTIAEAHLPAYRDAIESGKKLPPLLGM